MGQGIQKWTKLYHLNIFKGCLRQILLGPFLNALTQMPLKAVLCKVLVSRQPFLYINGTFTCRADFLEGFYKKNQKRFSAIHLLKSAEKNLERYRQDYVSVTSY